MTALQEALAAEGLHIALPINRDALTRARLGERLEAVLPGARGAVLVGDGGGVFFSRFLAAAPPGLDPLDRFTEATVAALVTRTLAGSGVHHALVFPFRPPYLSFQALGEAAGLPPPGPLGIQIHPRFGPWWAYRALIVLDAEVPAPEPLEAPCVACPAPCAAACPAGAARLTGLSVEACVGQRLRDPGCAQACAARVACVRGPEHRYPDHQVAFHAAASLAQIRRGRPGTSGHHPAP